MNLSTHDAPSVGRDAAPALWRIGCVSYLNSKPLIEGVGDDPTYAVKFDVPSMLLGDLLARRTDIALCPVIDYFRSPELLSIVPVGGIGCFGPTLTVRIFSRVPIDRITAVHADIDSHTSVGLARVLLAQRHGIKPAMIHFDASKHQFTATDPDGPETALLIGDKVVTNEPSREAYPYQVDLGQWWREMTGLPFLFATWLCRKDAELGGLASHLEKCRLVNAGQIPQIVGKYAPIHGWPEALAQKYLGELLRYGVGKTELTAMSRFGAMAEQIGVIDEARELALR